MIDKELFGATAAAFTLASYVPYTLSTLRGRTRPHTYSWLIWALASGIAAAAQLVKGSGAGAWSIVLSTVFCGLIGVVGWRHGNLATTRLDRWMFAVAVAAIPLWYLTSNASLALILMMLVDTLAFAMTMRKAWSHPNEEMATSYCLYAIAMGLSLFALETYTVMTVLYPAFILAANAATALLVIMRRSAAA